MWYLREQGCGKLLERHGGQGSKEHRTKMGQRFRGPFALHSGQGHLESQQIPRECRSMLDVH